ncbi:transcription antitermination factor NusB [Desulfocurvibacter africanus]|uniref:transcription antitermination factor NusB n=1 Tax=Desulfocurvibacter africanus TaxID=873 RepID=UPI000411A6E1|nr:transcription antitermination factor NusB [Desulfocurvibacter africanus]
MTADRIPPARRAALEAVSKSLNTSTDVQAALDTQITARRLAPRDIGLATELTYGYLRLKGRLDALLDHFLRAPGKLPARVRLVLGLAAYELSYLDRVPAYASVNWAVDAVKADFGQGLSKMANGVLRSVERLGADALNPDFFRQGSRDETGFLSRYYSCPRWIVELWLGERGREAALALLQAQIVPPAVGLRVNAAKSSAQALRDELAAKPECLSANGWTLAFAPGSRPVEDSVLTQGLVSRQSAASQLALAALEPTGWPTPVWDCCCGRGGKALSLIEKGIAPVWASDVTFARLRQLPVESRRLGLPAVSTFLARADAPAPLAAQPGTVLVDAPCSGLGVLSRRPDSKWKRSPTDLPGLTALQSGILEHALAALRPGGRLAYITCTVNRAENEERIEMLLREHSGARLLLSGASPLDWPLGEFFFHALIARS